MKVALVSLDQAWEDKKTNQVQCSYISKKIVENHTNVDLIIYPEMTLTGFSVANKTLSEIENDSESKEYFQKLSQQKNVSHLVGISVKNEENKQFNRCYYIDETGVVLSEYDKIHTFSFAGEDKLFTRGSKPQVVVKGPAKVGLSICYDLRFSPLYSFYRKNCNLIINIANWPSVRRNHWINLLQSRAIENQTFMIGVNRTGVDGNGLSYNKSSMIFDPLGELVNPIYTDEAYSLYNIELADVEKVRAEFPFIEDFRPELYSNFNR